MLFAVLQTPEPHKRHVKITENVKSGLYVVTAMSCCLSPSQSQWICSGSSNCIRSIKFYVIHSMHCQWLIYNNLPTHAQSLYLHIYITLKLQAILHITAHFFHMMHEMFGIDRLQKCFIDKHLVYMPHDEDPKGLKHIGVVNALM